MLQIIILLSFYLILNVRLWTAMEYFNKAVMLLLPNAGRSIQIFYHMRKYGKTYIHNPTPTTKYYKLVGGV